MKLDDLVVSRRGKNVVLNHQQYQIEFNLAKGIWNYNDKNGKTIIKNGFTQICLKDGTTLKSLDSGYREFHSEPVQNDAFGNYQTLKFTYETVVTDKKSKKSSQKRNSKKTASSNNPPNTNDADDSQQNTIESSEDVSQGTGIRIHTYLTCYADHPYILLKVGVENLRHTPICLTNITLIDISSQQGTLQLGGHPTQYNLFLKMPPISPDASVHHKIYDGFRLDGEKMLQPCQEGVLHDTVSKKSILFGFITTNKLWPRIQLGYQVSKQKTQQGLTTWALYHDCENMICQTGEEITSEIGYLDYSEDAHSSYKRYTERLAADIPTQSTQNLPQESYTDTSPQPVFHQQIFKGWCFSSENINGKFGAKTIKEQIDAITENSLLKPMVESGMDYIHLETGWQASPGNLTLKKDCFPEGMRNIVDQIHQSGFKAGISIDPFAIDTNTDLVQKSPEVCLRHNGREKTKSPDKKQHRPIEVHLPNRESALGILDVSHPKTQKHVKTILKQIIDDWSYDIIKVDLSSYTSGMMSISQNADWHDNSLTSTELYRKAISLLKEAVDMAEKDVLLAGYNIIESVSMGTFMLNFPLIRQKYVDNSDSWHHQNGTKQRLRRYTGYLNDPDSVWEHVYGDLCIDEPRPVNEAIVEMTAAALSGNSILCMNIPSSLSTHRAELMAKLFPLSGNAAKTVDRYEEPFPQIWHLPIETQRGSWDILGIFNWKDQQEDVNLNLETIGLQPDKAYHVHDFWMRQYLGVVSKNVTLINIAPRSAKLLCFREEQQTPQLLATDIHYTQGSVEILSEGWDDRSQSFLVICKPIRQSEGSLFFYVPESYIPIGVSALGSEYQYRWDKPIYQLTFNSNESLIHASIQFTKTEGGSRIS